LSDPRKREESANDMHQDEGSDPGMGDVAPFSDIVPIKPPSPRPSRGDHRLAFLPGRLRRQLPVPDAVQGVVLEVREQKRRLVVVYDAAAWFGEKS
jgi:hypothetical protein